MFKIGIVFPFSYVEPEKISIDIDIYNIFKALNSMNNNLLFFFLDLCSLDLDGNIESYDINRSTLASAHLSDYKIIHFMDFENRITEQLTLNQKWNFIDNKLKIFSNFNSIYINPIASLYTFVSKGYLFDLEKKNIQIIPTTLIKFYQIYLFKNIEDFVIKPINGDAGSHVIRLSKSSDIELNALKEQSTDFLLQPYFNEINDGEISVIFIGEKISHAVKKQMSFCENGKLNKGKIDTYELSHSDIEFANKVKIAIGQPLDIFRVDFISTKSGYKLMEIEAVDPFHYAKHTDLFYLHNLNKLYLTKLSCYKYES